MKARTIGYWVTTGILVFCMTGGIFELLEVSTTMDGITRFGYPPYIIPALGLGKMLGAFVSHVANHDPAWTLVVTLTIAAITLASWALRAQSRQMVSVMS